MMMGCIGPLPNGEIRVQRPECSRAVDLETAAQRFRKHEGQSTAEGKPNGNTACVTSKPRAHCSRRYRDDGQRGSEMVRDGQRGSEMAREGQRWSERARGSREGQRVPERDESQ
jgi:hypothetical protein